MFAEHLRFFDRYLKGVENGIDTEDRVYYYTYNAPRGERWSSSPVWPVRGMRPATLVSRRRSRCAQPFPGPARRGAGPHL